MRFKRARALAWGVSLFAALVAGTAYVPVFGQVLPGNPFGGGGSGGGLSYPLLDNAFEVCDEADTTKCVQFSTGGMTTANDIALTLSGTAAAPTLKLGETYLSHDGSNARLAGGSGDGIEFATNTTTVRAFWLTGWNLASSHCYRVASAVAPTDANADTFLCREGAAIWQLGQDVNGAAVAQTLKAHDGITGTDVAGANFTLAGGRGTGAGAGGNIIKQTAYTLGTGTTAQTLADREIVVAKPKALTAASATAFVEIAVPQGTVAGGTIEYTIRANDATNYQARSGVLVYSAVNPAGTEVCTLSRPDGGTTVDNTTDSVAVSSGTLTNTFTCTVGLTDVVRIAANAASSLTETVLQISYTVRKNEGSGAITPQ